MAMDLKWRIGKKRAGARGMKASGNAMCECCKRRMVGCEGHGKGWSISLFAIAAPFEFSSFGLKDFSSFCISKVLPLLRTFNFAAFASSTGFRVRILRFQNSSTVLPYSTGTLPTILAEVPVCSSICHYLGNFNSKVSPKGGC